MVVVFAFGVLHELMMILDKTKKKKKTGDQRHQGQGRDRHQIWKRHLCGWTMGCAS